LFGMTAAVLGLSELFMNGIWWLPVYVAGGDLDRLLIYPVNGLALLLFTRPELHAVGNVLSGAVMIGVSWHATRPPGLAYLLLPLWISSGAVIYTSVLTMIGSLSFRTAGASTDTYLVAHHLLTAARYPIGIYPRWLQLVMLCFFPIGTAISLPGRWLAGSGPLWSVILAPCAAAAATMSIAYQLWRRAVRHYQSTGN
jgi:viologen exporter family transport system permease protein